MHLAVLKGARPGAVYALDPGEHTAGRSPGCAVHLPSAHVSGTHCVFVVGPDGVVVRDLGSTNGLFVEGQRVAEARLQHGHRIQVGDWLLQLHAPEAAPAVGPALPRTVDPATHPGPALVPEPVAPAPPPADPGPRLVPSALAPGGDITAGPDPRPAPAAVSVDPGAAAGGFGLPAPSGGIPFGAAAPSGRPAFGMSPAGASGAGPVFGARESMGTAPSVAPSFAAGGPVPATGGAFNPEPALPAAAPPPRGHPADAVEPGDWVAALRQSWRRIRRFPWPLQLAGILAVAAFVLFLAPGGLLHQVRKGSAMAESQSLGRGRAIALAVASRNLQAIAAMDNLKLDVEFVLNEPGVKAAKITDTRGVVRAPHEQVGQTLGGKDFFARATEEGRAIVAEKGGGEWHVLSPIRGSIGEGAPTTLLGWSYVLYDVDSALDGGDRFLIRVGGGLFVLALVFAGAGVASWRLAAVPVRQVRDELELVLRGHSPAVAAPVEWPELGELAHSINRLVTRWQKAGAGVPVTSEVEIRPTLEALVEDLPVPAFLVETEGRVVQASQASCQWLGTSREALVGRRLGEVLPDPDFLARLARVCVAGGGPATETARIGANRVLLRSIVDSRGTLVLVTVG